MLEITDAQISSWVSHVLWPLFRITAFFSIVPIFGSRLVTIRVRVMLGAIVTTIVYPLLPPMPVIESLSLLTWIIIAQQMVIGVALGFLVLTLFQVFILAGQTIAMQMGLGYASMMDPANGVSVTVLSQWYLTLVTLIFLALNGHLIVVEVMIESFYTLPVGPQGLSTTSFYQIAQWGQWLFASAVSLALPAIGALLLVNLSFGVISRAAPSMNVFALGFPITMMMGLLVLWLSFSSVATTVQVYFEQLVDMMKAIVLIQP